MIELNPKRIFIYIFKSDMLSVCGGWLSACACNHHRIFIYKNIILFNKIHQNVLHFLIFRCVYKCICIAVAMKIQIIRDLNLSMTMMIAGMVRFDKFQYEFIRNQEKFVCSKLIEVRSLSPCCYDITFGLFNNFILLVAAVIVICILYGRE